MSEAVTATPTQPSAAAPPSGTGQAATTAQSNLPKPPPGSRFDNKLFREIKLTEIPVFLWENSGWNGLFRFKIFLQKRMSSPCNPIAEYAIRWPLAIVGFLMIPGLIGVYRKNTGMFLIIIIIIDVMNICSQMLFIMNRNKRCPDTCQVW
jgi:hypothetical protein